MAINAGWALARVKWVLGVPLALIVLLLGTCELAHPTYAYRYRLTLDVELPDGEVRSGSSVVEVEQGCQLSPAAPGSYYRRVTGEATVADLGGGRLLVALLTGQFPYEPGWGEKEPTRVLARAYRVLLEPRGCRNSDLGRLERLRGARELSTYDLPRLVTFADAAAPRTVAQVDPRDLAASFGPGTRLRRATIEVTSDRVTRGDVERALPWLRGVTSYLDGRNVSSGRTLANTLTRSDFKRESL